MKKLASLMRPVDSTNPTFYVRRALTTTLGLPLATAERQGVDAQGSPGIYFHEGSYKNGDPSDRVFGLSCAHVLRANTTVDYEYAGERTGTPKQKVRVCDSRRFQEAIEETTDLIGTKVEEIADFGYRDCPFGGGGEERGRGRGRGTRGRAGVEDSSARGKI